MTSDEGAPVVVSLSEYRRRRRLRAAQEWIAAGNSTAVCTDCGEVLPLGTTEHDCLA